jgi:hypothetical protein
MLQPWRASIFLANISSSNALATTACRFIVVKYLFDHLPAKYGLLSLSEKPKRFGAGRQFNIFIFSLDENRRVS